MNKSRTNKNRSKKNKTKKVNKNFAISNSFETEFEKKYKKELKDEASDIDKKLIRMFNKPFSPSKITPRNDYYTYINYIWLLNTNKDSLAATSDKYYVQIDDFRLTQDKVYNQLIEMVENFTKTTHSKKSRLIKNMYTSLLNLKFIQFSSNNLEKIELHLVNIKSGLSMIYYIQFIFLFLMKDDIL